VLRWSDVNFFLCLIRLRDKITVGHDHTLYYDDDIALLKTLKEGFIHPPRMSHRKINASPTQTVVVPRSAFLEGSFTPFLAVCAAAALGWKLYRTCVVHTNPDTLTVVYNVRRRSILTSSATEAEQLPDPPRPKSFLASPLEWTLRFACRPRFAHVLLMPPFFGLYRVFTIPRSALNPMQGIRVHCSVEGVTLRDGAVNFVLSVTGVVDARELDRYLAIVGPVPPMESIGRCVATVLRESYDVTGDRGAASTATVGQVLDLSKWSSSNGALLEKLRAKLRQRMVTDCCVVLKDVTMERVELTSALMPS
jgi:hypothetical protein